MYINRETGFFPAFDRHVLETNPEWVVGTPPPAPWERVRVLPIPQPKDNYFVFMEKPNPGENFNTWVFLSKMGDDQRVQNIDFYNKKILSGQELDEQDVAFFTR